MLDDFEGRTSQLLAGKTALVTAAGQGIGRAIAEALAAEGALVTATDINLTALEQLDRSGLSTAVLDATDPRHIERVAADCDTDILVNVAGVVHAGALLQATVDELDHALALNVRSIFNLCKATLPGMISRGGGSIINIGSVASSIKGVPDRCVYGTSKAAIIGLTKSIAADYVGQGIRCNAICPGTVETPSLAERLAAAGDAEPARRSFTARQPMGRIGRPEEIADLALWLSSAKFVTGQAICIDGGWTI